MEQRIANRFLRPDQAQEHDACIECVSIVGTKLLFNLKLLPVFFKQPDIWLFSISFVTLMTIMDPTGAVGLSSYLAVAATWLLVSVLYVGLTVSALAVLYLILKKTRIRTVILPFVSFSIVWALIALGPLIEKIFIGDLGEQTTVIPFSEVLLCFSVEQVFSILYVSMGFPLMMQRLDRAGAAAARSEALLPPTQAHERADQADSLAPRPEEQMIQLGKLSLKVADICAVSADEHYVCIQTETQQDHTRERFSRVISHLPASLGFQVHRSHWVAFSAVQDIIQNGAQHSVTLKTGDSLPISKARKREFKEALIVFKALAVK
jgi:hypothetical protein